MIELNAENVGSYNEITGTNEPLPGRYHVVVQSVDESLEKIQAVIVEFQVVKGTIPGQEGRVHRELFSASEKKFPRDRLTRLAMILGLIGKEKKAVTFAHGIGRQMVITVDNEEYNGKINLRIPRMEYWALGDPAVKDVPIDEVVAAKLGGMVVQPVAAPAATQPTGEKKPDWSKL